MLSKGTILFHVVAYIKISPKIRITSRMLKKPAPLSSFHSVFQLSFLDYTTIADEGINHAKHTLHYKMSSIILLSLEAI